MKTLGELTDEVVAAANAYHELRDDKRWTNLHSAIEAWNKRRAEVKATQKQKANGSLRNCDIFRDVRSAMVQFMKEKPKCFKPDKRMAFTTPLFGLGEWMLSVRERKEDAV